MNTSTPTAIIEGEAVALEQYRAVSDDTVPDVRPVACARAPVEISKEIVAVIEQQHFYVTISGKRYVTCPLKVAGGMLGLFPYTVWTRPNESQDGYIARVEVRTADRHDRGGGSGVRAGRVDLEEPAKARAPLNGRDSCDESGAARADGAGLRATRVRGHGRRRDSATGRMSRRRAIEGQTVLFDRSKFTVDEQRCPCALCGGMPVPDEYADHTDPHLRKYWGADPCLGWLPGVKAACCGHDEPLLRNPLCDALTAIAPSSTATMRRGSCATSEGTRQRERSTRHGRRA